VKYIFFRGDSNDNDGSTFGGVVGNDAGGQGNLTELSDSGEGCGGG
jgi:hypothetical protein